MLVQCVHIGGYIEKAVLVYMCTASAAACVHRIGRTDRVVESDFLMDFPMDFPMDFLMDFLMEKTNSRLSTFHHTFCCEAPSENIFDNGAARSERTATNGAAQTESTATNGAARTESTAAKGKYNPKAQPPTERHELKAQPITGKAQNKIYPKKRNSCCPTRAEWRFGQQKAGKTPLYAQ